MRFFRQIDENTMANTLLPSKMHTQCAIVPCAKFAVFSAYGKVAHWELVCVHFTRQNRVSHSIFINLPKKPHKIIDKRWRKRGKSVFPAWKTCLVLCVPYGHYWIFFQTIFCPWEYSQGLIKLPFYFCVIDSCRFGPEGRKPYIFSFSSVWQSSTARQYGKCFRA